MEEYLAQFVAWTKLKVRLHIKPEDGVYFYEREIWWASLGANVGYEQDGKHEYFERPVLVLKKFNKHILWALPITSKEKIGDYYHPIEYDSERYSVILSQLRLISSKRLLRKIRTLPEEEFSTIKEKIKNFL